VRFLGANVTFRAPPARASPPGSAGWRTNRVLTRLFRAKPRFVELTSFSLTWPVRSMASRHAASSLEPGSVAPRSTSACVRVTCSLSIGACTRSASRGRDRGSLDGGDSCRRSRRGPQPSLSRAALEDPAATHLRAGGDEAGQAWVAARARRPRGLASCRRGHQPAGNSRYICPAHAARPGGSSRAACVGEGDGRGGGAAAHRPPLAFRPTRAIPTSQGFGCGAPVAAPEQGPERHAERLRGGLSRPADPRRPVTAAIQRGPRRGGSFHRGRLPVGLAGVDRRARRAGRARHAARFRGGPPTRPAPACRGMAGDEGHLGAAVRRAGRDRRRPSQGTYPYMQ
jgi:hypothetical protein